MRILARITNGALGLMIVAGVVAERTHAQTSTTDSTRRAERARQIKRQTTQESLEYARTHERGVHVHLVGQMPAALPPAFRDAAGVIIRHMPGRGGDEIYVKRSAASETVIAKALGVLTQSRRTRGDYLPSTEVMIVPTDSEPVNATNREIAARVRAGLNRAVPRADRQGNSYASYSIKLVRIQ